MYKNIRRGLISTMLILSLIISNNVGEYPKSKDMDEFFEFSKSLEETFIPYNENDLYRTNAKIAEIITTRATSCKNGEEDLETVLNCIVENTKGRNDDFFKEDKNRKLKIEALREALESVFAYGHITVEDICKIKSLKITEAETVPYIRTSTTKYYIEDNTFCIDIASLNSLKIGYFSIYEKCETLEERLRLAYEIALNNARISLCDCRPSNTSIREIFPNLTKQTAVTEIYNRRNNAYDHIGNLHQYPEEEALILLTQAFNEEACIDDYYDAILSNDFKKLFSFFELDVTDEHTVHAQIERGGLSDLGTIYDYKRIFRILESFELASQNTKSEVGYSYIVDIYRLALDGLSVQLGIYKDLNLDEALYLYDFIRAMIAEYIEEIIIDDQGIDHTFPLELKDTFEQIDDAFYEYLSSLYKKNIDYIKKRKENMSFECLKTGDNKFINFKKLTERFPLLNIIVRDSCPHRATLEDMEEFYLNHSIEPQKRINLS